MFGAAHGALTVGYDPALSAGVSSPVSANQQFDYTSAIDPALESASAPTTAAASYPITTRYVKLPRWPSKGKCRVQAHTHPARPTLRTLEVTPRPCVSPSVASLAEVAANTISPAKRTINNLLALGGAAPPPSTADITQSPSMLDEIKHLYYSIYAPWS